jgi:hypothetical protein
MSNNKDKEAADAAGEFHEIPTVKRYIIPCRFCGGLYPHKLHFGSLLAMPHPAPCLLACMGGGIGINTLKYHDEHCEICYKLK